MRRILYYSLLCFLWVSVNSCSEDEASQPPTPTLQNVSGFSSGMLSETKFTFEVQQVGAGSMSFLPYGVENPSFGGILIPASSFEAGKAKIEFTYGHVGTFQAVAAANNHSGDGNSVKTSYSAAVPITITSNKAELTDFSFDKSTKTEVTAGDPTVVKITLPWSRQADKGALALRFTKSPESKVTVGGTEVSNDANPQNFSTGPVTYTVTSHDGTATADYEVYVIQTPAESTTTLKSAGGIINNKGKIGEGAIKVARGRALPTYIDNVNRYVVVYDTLNSTLTAYDSLGFDFTLNGSFASTKYTAANGWHAADEKFEAKDTLDLGGNPGVDFTVTAENGDTETYTVYMGEAPKLHVMSTNLNPSVSGTSNENFAVNLNVLDGTDKTDIDSDFTFDVPAGATITQVKIAGAALPLVGVGGVYSAASVDYSAGIKLEVTVSHPDVPESYVVTYSIGLTVK